MSYNLQLAKDNEATRDKRRAWADLSADEAAAGGRIKRRELAVGADGAHGVDAGGVTTVQRDAVAHENVALPDAGALALERTVLLLQPAALAARAIDAQDVGAAEVPSHFGAGGRCGAVRCEVLAAVAVAVAVAVVTVGSWEWSGCARKVGAMVAEGEGRGLM